MTAFQTGTATDYKDLLSDLRAFLTTHADLVAAGEEWTEKRWDDDVGGTGECELIIMGPGLAGDDEIYVGVQTYSSGGDDYYNWKLQGFTGYSDGIAFASQPGAIGDAYPPSLALSAASLPYWFAADGRRFVAAARVGSVYEAGYLGFLLPYGLPSQYPYPLAVGGSITGQYGGFRYSIQNPTHRVFVSPGGQYGAAADEYRAYSTLRVLHGNWLSVRTFYGTTEPGNESRLYRETWPYGDGYANNSWAAMRDNIDGSFPLFPILVYQEDPSDNVFGELAGCLAVPGYGLAPEDVITVSGVDHIVFPNAFRSSAAEWWALRME